MSRPRGFLSLAAAVLASVAALGACGSGGGEPSRSTGSASASAAEAAVCPEHGVLEAVCTRCNPRLVPVFQAKGDWCAEHGFPESFCPVCHPERGGRPLAEVAGDDAPADGVKVRLATKDTARLAGIETARALERPGGARLQALGTIAYDATRRAELNARAAGVVRALHVDVGASVDAGAPLASIESADVGAERSRRQAAAARVRVAEANLEREKRLHERGISPLRDVEAAEQELEAARAEHAAASSALGVVGAARGRAGTYVLCSPIRGTVTRRQATVGRLVGTEEILFEIVDTSTMWAELDVPEGELGALRRGQAVSVVVDGLGERRFTGTIGHIAPEVDPRTRTARARVALANPDGALRANMFARAEIEQGAVRPTVTVPVAALQRAGGVHMVFVRAGDDLFETRRVKPGLRQGDAVEVVEGLAPGEEVATRGSFLLKTETLKSSIGAGCCEGE